MFITDGYAFWCLLAHLLYVMKVSRQKMFTGFQRSVKNTLSFRLNDLLGLFCKDVLYSINFSKNGSTNYYFSQTVVIHQ